MEKSYTRNLVVTVTAIMLIISCSAADKSTPVVAVPAKILDPGSSWVVSETTTLSGLTIAGGTISASEGYSLTMTVDGVETPIKTGAYDGRIVLTVTEI